MKGPITLIGKNIVIVSAVLLLIFVMGGSYFFSRATAPIHSDDTIADFVVHGSSATINKVSKKVVFEDFFSGGITNIQIGNFDTIKNNEVAVLSQSEIFFLNPAGYLLSQKKEFFDDKSEKIWFGLAPSLIDTNNDGIFEIMEGGEGFGDTALLDNKGRQLWKFRGDSVVPPSKMISGDLNEDGIPEFYAINFLDLYQLDHKGKTVWHMNSKKDTRAEKFFVDIAVLKSPIFSTPVIAVVKTNIAGGADGKVIQFFDYYKKLLKEVKFDTPIDNLKVIDWPDGPHFLTGYYGNEIAVLDLNGEFIFRKKLENKDFAPYHGPYGVAVKLVSGEKPYLAVLANSDSATHLSQLTIISNSGEIVYQETIDKTTGILAYSSDGSGREVLLVGDGTKRLLEYSIQSK